MPTELTCIACRHRFTPEGAAGPFVTCPACRLRFPAVVPSAPPAAPEEVPVAELDEDVPVGELEEEAPVPVALPARKARAVGIDLGGIAVPPLDLLRPFEYSIRNPC